MLKKESVPSSKVITNERVLGLIMGGGSSLGAYEAGVIDSITEKEPDRPWKVFTGISVGSINAACMAQERVGFARLASEKLSGLWMGLQGSKDIYKGGLLGAFTLAFRTGVFNIKPLEMLLYREFDQQRVLDSGNILRFGAVDLVTGRYREFTEGSVNAIDGILASASMPFAFPTVNVGQAVYTDGGIRCPAAFDAAIEAGCDEIDLIVTAPLGYEVRVKQMYPDNFKNGMNVGLRLLELFMDQIFISSLMLFNHCNERAKLGDPKYKYIKTNVYAPTQVLSADMLLTAFDPKQLRDWFMHGQSIKPILLEDYLKGIKLTQKV